MIERDKFIKQTNNLIRYYEGKVSPIKDYLKTVIIYSKKIDDILTKSIFDVVEANDKVKMTIEIVCFYTDLNLENLIDIANRGSFITPFEVEFMEYFLIHKKEIRKPLQWAQICALYSKYNTMTLDYIVKGMLEDFNKEIGFKLTLAELWKSS